MSQDANFLKQEEQNPFFFSFFIKQLQATQYFFPVSLISSFLPKYLLKKKLYFLYT